jgi:hypothetical protein
VDEARVNCFNNIIIPHHISLELIRPVIEHNWNMNGPMIGCRRLRIFVRGNKCSNEYPFAFKKFISVIHRVSPKNHSRDYTTGEYQMSMTYFCNG